MKYVRAADNLFFVVDGHVAGHVVIDYLNARIKPYQVKLECEWGPKSDLGSAVQFFDFEVVKTSEFVRSGILLFRPTLRDNGPVLSYPSAHTPGIHLSWPVAFCNRLYKRSSTIEAYVVAKQMFLQRLRLAGVPNFITKYVDMSCRYFLPYHHPLCTQAKRSRFDNTLFLVMPFHPLWRLTKMSSALREFLRDDDVQSLLKGIFRNPASFNCQVSWKIPIRPIGQSFIEW